MKKFVSILLTCLLFASCENFLTDNLDSAKKMAEEVRFNTAAQILVTVISESGTVVTGSNRDARVGIPFEIELSLPKSVGVFEKWYAVVRDKDNNETLLTSDDIVFENENSLKTNVTLLNELKGVYVIAKVQENPVLSITYDNIDFYSKNSTNESKGLIVNQKTISENENLFYQNFVIQTINDYGTSFDRIRFCSNDGVTETQIPVYTLNEFYALGENIPKPYTYIINCEDGNPETGSDENGSFYTSAVTNALLCLFNVSENFFSEGAVKISFNACLFRNLENMLYIKTSAGSYPKVSGNIEGYENTTISPNTPKVILPSKDVTFNINIPDQYSYESLSFTTESGAIPEIYTSTSDIVDETSDAVKTAALAVYAIKVETTESSEYESKTAVSFKVKSINGFSELINIRPVLKVKKPLSFSADSNSSVTPSGSIKAMAENGVNFSFTATDLYAISAILVLDASGNTLYKYGTTGNKTIPETILMGDETNNYGTIKNAKLESNLSMFSGSFYVNSELTQAVTVTAETKVRPTVHNTEPYSYEKNVMRTAPIYIRFSKPMKAFANESTYLDYISVERCDSSSVLDGQGENVFEAGTHPRYFKNPELKNNGYELLISALNNTVESEWMKSGSEVRIHINKSFTDAEGIPLKDDYNFSYTLGTSGDSFGPIISTEKTSLTIVSSGKTISQSEWGDFEPLKNPDPLHTYTDSSRVANGEKFRFKTFASDVSTGNTGIKNFVATVRLVYVYENGFLPKSSIRAPKNLRLFDEKGEWLYESGYSKQDFYKQYYFANNDKNLESESDDSCVFNLDEFKSEDNNPVDGIYMIEISAADALDNISSNSCVYYVVRDTTPPASELNANKIVLDNDCGVVVNGKRFFSKTYNSFIFSTGENLIDFGSQGYPWTSSKPDEIQYSIVISKNKNSCNENEIVAKSLRYTYQNEKNKAVFDETCFETLNKDSELFAFAKFKDFFGNESEYAYVSSISLFVDVENDCNFDFTFTDSERINARTPVKNLKNEYECDIVTSLDTATVIVNALDFSTTNLSSQLKAIELYEVLDGKIVTSSKQTGISGSAFNIEKHKNYVFFFIDNGENVTKCWINVETDDEPPVVSDLYVNDYSWTSVTGFIEKPNGNYAVKEWDNYGNLTFDEVDYSTRGYSKGDVYISFVLNERGKGIRTDSITFENMTISSYVIYDKEGNQLDEDYYDNEQNYIQISNGSLFENSKFEVYGDLNNVTPGLGEQRTIVMTIKDMVNTVRTEIPVILDTKGPDLYLEPCSSETYKYEIENQYKDEHGIDNYIVSFITDNMKGSGNNVNTYNQDYWYTKLSLKAEESKSSTSIGQVYFDLGSFRTYSTPINYKYSFNIYKTSNNYSSYYAFGQNGNKVQYNYNNKIIPKNFAEEGQSVYSISSIDFLMPEKNISVDFTISAYDVLGNFSTIIIHCQKDKEPPELEVNQITSLYSNKPASENYFSYKDGTGLKFNIVDKSYIKEYDFYGEKSGIVISGNRSEITLYDPNNGTGENWSVTLTDRYDNKANYNFFIIEDKIPPKINITQCIGLNNKVQITDPGSHDPSDRDNDNNKVHFDAYDQLFGLFNSDGYTLNDTYKNGNDSETEIKYVNYVFLEFTIDELESGLDNVWVNESDMKNCYYRIGKKSGTKGNSNDSSSINYYTCWKKSRYVSGSREKGQIYKIYKNPNDKTNSNEKNLFNSSIDQPTFFQLIIENPSDELLLTCTDRVEQKTGKKLKFSKINP